MRGLWPWYSTLDTGLLSPQFHVKFDKFFETVNNQDNDYPNRWKVLTHFEKGGCSRDKNPEDFNTTQTDHHGQESKATSLPSNMEHQNMSDARTIILPSPNSPENVKAPLTKSDNSPSVQWLQQHKPSQRLRESIDQGLIAFQSVFDDYKGHEEYLIQKELSHPLAFAANKADSDTIYMHQAMRQPDRKQFVKAMQDEINAHTKNRHWEVIEHLQVLEGAKILPSVWAMKRKRRISTGEVYKWKA